MKKVVVEIIGKSGKSFDLTFTNDAWFGFEGDWGCLPGFMPATKGYFNYISSNNVIHIWNRERTFGESLKYGVFLDSPSPTKIHGALDDFPGDPVVGKTGKGHIFDHGKSAEGILKDHLGFVTADVTWKVKSVI
jgi:hypothetical protein